MGAFKRVMGLDVIDVGIQIVVTGFLAGVADVASSTDGEGVVMLLLAASTVLFGVRRHYALRRARQFPEPTGEVTSLRMEELEMRMAELEHGQMRVQELEDRLDFAERMLMQQRDARQLSAREDP